MEKHRQELVEFLVNDVADRIENPVQEAGMKSLKEKYEQLVSEKTDSKEAEKLEEDLYDPFRQAIKRQLEAMSVLIEEEVEENPDKGRLYRIEASKDGFAAVLPGLRNEGGHIVGTTKIYFSTIEAAQEAIEQSKQRSQQQTEHIALQPTFTAERYSIEEKPEGGFEVVVPILSPEGVYQGWIRKTFSDWEEARDFYLEKLEVESKLTHAVHVELEVGEGQVLSFEGCEDFDPQVTPSLKSLDIPDAIQACFLKEENMNPTTNPNAITYQKTLEREGWENEIFAFIQNYLKEEQKNDQDILDRLNIENLQSLTPRQAMDLCLIIVKQLTKYDHSQANSKGFNGFNDQSDVLTLLKEGRNKRNDPNWSGNGVCRNFTCMVKAVFEAIKAHQLPLNYLRNTYCLYDSGTNFAPQRPGKKLYFSHAWNQFVTLTSKGANSTIPDVTWGEFDAASGQVDGVDHTLVRSERVVYEIAQGLNPSNQNYQSQLEQIITFYEAKLGKPGMVEDCLDETTEQDFFAYRLLQILKNQEIIPSLSVNLQMKLMRNYAFRDREEHGSSTNLSEIQLLWRIKMNQERSPIHMSEIIKRHFSRVSLTNQSDTMVEFLTRVNDPDLQAEIFIYLLSNEDRETREFSRHIETSGKIRAWFREIFPKDREFLGPTFDPVNNWPDYRELLYLKDKAVALRKINLDRKKLPTVDDFERVIETAKSILIERHPTKDSEINTIAVYTLFKDFNKLMNKGAEAFS